MSRWSIPPNWEWAHTSDISRVVGGGTPKSKDPTNFDPYGHPWLTPADLSGYDQPYISRGARSLSEKGLSSCGAQLMPSGTVLYTSRAPIGYCVIASNEISTNQGFKSLVLEGRIEPRYIRHYLLSAKEYAESLSSGSTFKELSAKRMQLVEIPIAPLPEQKRIADKIDALQAKSKKAREALEAVRPLLDKLRQSVLASAFRGDLTADWRAKNPDVESASALLERIRKECRRKWEKAELAKMRAKGKEPKNNKWKDRYKEPEPVDTTELPELPKGWCWASVGFLCMGNIQTGPFGAQLHKSEYVSEGVPVLNIGNVKWGVIDLNEINYVTPRKAEELKKYELQTGDVLFTRSGTVGRSAVVPASANAFLMSGHILRIRQDDRWYSQELLFMAFRGEPTISAQLKYLTRGATRAGFNTTLLSDIVLPVPPREEQKTIVHKLNQLLSSCEEIESICGQATKRCNMLDQSIFTKAFRGEIVPQDPNDEPASVLLERIKAEREALKPKKRKTTRKRKKTAA